ncbi:hypothetical protein D9M71_248700 [compost metagenome]
MRLDQVHQFRRQVDVGLFQGVGHYGPQGSGGRCIDAGNARGIGFFPLAAADRLQALFVGEAGDRNLADGLGLLVTETGKHHAAFVDGQAGDDARGIPVLALRGTRGGRIVGGGLGHIDGDAGGIADRSIGAPDRRSSGWIGDGCGHPTGDLEHIIGHRHARASRHGVDAAIGVEGDVGT